MNVMSFLSDFPRPLPSFVWHFPSDLYCLHHCYFSQGLEGDQSIEETLIDLFSNPGHLECSMGTVYRRTLPKGM